MSIFVNPTQFGPTEDYQKYPRLFEQDCEMAKAAGCEVVFAPSVSDMYPQNYNTYVNVEKITDTLCGASRPGHFRGVATVVLKLFNIVNPQIAVFGQKDAQQVLTIKRMVRDLNCSDKIETAPIFRESDGLAMSSRNTYLTEVERKEAPLIYMSLKKAEELYFSGERNASVFKQIIADNLKHAVSFAPEYIELVDTLLLEPVSVLNSTTLVALACRMRESGTRLIDNSVLGGSL
jgi:pantoate--beta-alanine ligase